MLVEAKRTWSQATRATISRFLLGRTTLCCRNLNQVVAAGPKIAGQIVSWELRRRGRKTNLHRRVPFDQFVPVRDS
jgi:hypothetical protein